MRGVWAWGQVTNPTAGALARWLCTLWERREGAPLEPLSLALSPVPRFVVCCARLPGLWHPLAVVAWHLSLCRCCSRRRASLTCIVAPCWCAAPRPVLSLSVLQLAFPSPWCLPPPRGLSPPALLGGCAGHAEAGRELGSSCLPLAPAETGALDSFRVSPVQGPRWDCPWLVPLASVLGCLRCGGLACIDPVTDASGFPYSPSFDVGLGWCSGAVSLGRRHLPFWVGGRHAQVPPVCACACSSWPGPAGRPPGCVLVRLTYPVAGLSFFFVWAPPGLSCPCFGSSFGFFFCFFCVSSFPFPPTSALAPLLSPVFCASRPWVPWALALFVCLQPPPPIPPPCFLLPLSSHLPSGAPAVSGFLCLPAPERGGKSEVAHLWAKWLRQPCRFRNHPPLQSGGQNQKWPTCGQSGYVTSAVSGIPTASERGAKAEGAHLWAKWLRHPFRFGDPHRFRAGGKIRRGPFVGKVAT